MLSSQNGADFCFLSPQPNTR